MALKQEHRTKLNDRIRIKDSVTHMYEMARVYNEGFVRAQRHDDLGYPIIRIEWDKDHWAYSGEPDRWALEAHFDLVEDDMADKNEDFIKQMADLFARWQADGSPQDGDHADSVEDKPDPRPDHDLTFEEVLAKATEAAGASEAFVVITAVSEQYDGVDIIVPYVYTHEKREDAALLCDATMGDLVARAHGRMASILIDQSKSGSSGS